MMNVPWKQLGLQNWKYMREEKNKVKYIKTSKLSKAYSGQMQSLYSHSNKR